MRERWLPLLAPALLGVLALCQLALVHTAGLSPWKGGGFGMFATLDHGGFRSVRLYRVGAAGEEPIEPAPERRRLRRAARDLPSATHLRALAAAVGREPGEAVRVEVWRTRFDRELVPRREAIAELTLEAP